MFYKIYSICQFSLPDNLNSNNYNGKRRVTNEERHVTNEERHVTNEERHVTNEERHVTKVNKRVKMFARSDWMQIAVNGNFINY